MKKIGFITYSEQPNLTGDDRLLIEPFARRGYEVRPLPWEDRSVDLASFDAFVFRSCWDFHVKYAAFLDWCQALRTRGRPIWNDVSLLGWNLNKKYLVELAGDGVKVPRTRHLERGARVDRAWLSREFDGVDLVIKPAVSLNGLDTYRVGSGDRDRALTRIHALSATREVIVQEFLPQIQTTGEVSLMFFNKRFSHAIRKTAKPGEFRIHEEYGGQREVFTASPALIDEAERIVKRIKQPLLFARVDVVLREEGAEPLLIELELIDPVLFFSQHADAAETFVRAFTQLHP